MNPQQLPLVSIVIPAYKSMYFETALLSALQQSWRPLEIVVCDDSSDGAIERIVQKHATGDVSLHYSRNGVLLGEPGNLARCIELATGLYIKPLHDDDVLHPGCVAALVGALQADPQLVLVTSRRRRIDPQGKVLADILQTAPMFADDVRIEGPPLVSFLAAHPLNFVGEPSCVMARRSDLLALGKDLMKLDKEEIHWVGDLALYANLLHRGDLAMLVEPLCDFRVSPEQFSQAGRDQPGIGQQGHADFTRCLKQLGWQRPGDDPRQVRIWPLTAAGNATKVDLLACLQAAFVQAGNVNEVVDWLARRVPDQLQRKQVDTYLLGKGGGPELAIMVMADGAQPQQVAQTLASLERAREYYPAIRHQVITHACPISRARELNRALEQCQSPWLMLLSEGDELTPAGLMIAALELAAEPPCRAVYGDGLVRQGNGQLEHALRPDFNLDYLLSCPREMASHWLFRREVLVQAGGFDPDYSEALEWEMILRLIDRGGPAGLAHIAEPWVIRPATPARDSSQQRAALLRHLHRRGYANAGLHSPGPGLFAIDYGHEQPASVSMLMLLDAEPAAVQRCLISLVQHSADVAWELLIAVSNDTPASLLAWLGETARLLGGKLRSVPVAPRLGQTATLNALACEAQGDYLLLLRADTAALDGRWLHELLNHAQRPEVGVVGGLGLSGQGTVNSGATLLGLNGAAGTALQGWPWQDDGYRQRLRVEQNYSAVNGACLMIRRTLFNQLGGLDQEHFTDHGADTDLCLRVGAQGHLVVWTPRARLLHSRPAQPLADTVRQALWSRWGEQLARDPAHNGNLSFNRPGGFQLADSAMTWRPLVWRPLPVVLAQPADLKGCGHYRVIQPLQNLKQQGLVEGVLASGVPLADMQRYAPDSIILQRPINEAQLASLADLRAFSRAFKVYELDDYLPQLPIKSQHRREMPKDIVRLMRRGLACVDRFVVSTQALAEAFSDWHRDIRVVENRLDPLWWGALPVPPPSAERWPTKGRPRVGWAGGAGHSGDLELIANVVKALAQEVDWVFFGLCPQVLRPYIKEYHPGVALADYPATLARLDLDLALAPLEQNLFNECKSNLRLLELGICGYPVICSDIRCFAGDLPVVRVKNRFKDWIDAIRAQLADPHANARAGQALQARVRRDWMLDGTHLQVWRQAWLPD